MRAFGKKQFLKGRFSKQSPLADTYAQDCHVHQYEYGWVVKIRTTSEIVLEPQYTPRSV